MKQLMCPYIYNVSGPNGVKYDQNLLCEPELTDHVNLLKLSI